jgi:hypothetical protein
MILQLNPLFRAQILERGANWMNVLLRSSNYRADLAIKGVVLPLNNVFFSNHTTLTVVEKYFLQNYQFFRISTSRNLASDAGYNSATLLTGISLFILSQFSSFSRDVTTAEWHQAAVESAS